jgi:hypothetical protein
MFWNQNTMDYYMEIIIQYGIRTGKIGRKDLTEIKKINA